MCTKGEIENGIKTSCHTVTTGSSILSRPPRPKQRVRSRWETDALIKPWEFEAKRIVVAPHVVRGQTTNSRLLQRNLCSWLWPFFLYAKTVPCHFVVRMKTRVKKKTINRKEKNEKGHLRFFFFFRGGVFFKSFCIHTKRAMFGPQKKYSSAIGSPSVCTLLSAVGIALPLTHC